MGNCTRVLLRLLSQAMAVATSQSLETIEGVLERIIYSNEENHYTVAQLLPEGGSRRTEPIIIVGNLAATAGMMTMNMSGLT